MNQDDLLHRFIFEQCDMRGEIVTLTDSYRQVLQHNDYPAPIQQLLGEFLAAAALLSSTLKFDGIVSLQAKGEGAISMIMAECTHHNELRAIIRPAQGVDIESLEGSLPELLGGGVLAITLEPAKGDRYQGVVPLDADTLAGCLEHYFYQSEQLKTRLWLCADNSRVSGLLLQALPQQVSDSEQSNREHWHTATTLAETVTCDELLNIEHSELLYRLFNEMSVRLFSPSRLKFSCSCSRERSANALKSLGRDEVEKLLVERGEIDIDCQFCNRHYRFDAAGVRALFGDGTLH